MFDRNNFVGPWAGVPTAWHDDGRFDEATYRRDVRACCQAGAFGVYTHGTTGEFYAMELDEWQTVSRAAVEECRAAGTPVMLGVTSTYTLGAVRRARLAVELGADAVQLALPYWLPMPDDQIVPFFREVADAAGELAMSIYDTQRAKKMLTVAQHQAIHEAVPKYMMVKATSISEAACAVLSKWVQVFVEESQWARLGPHGAIGCASSNFYTNPRYILAMFAALRDRDWSRLQPMCEKLIAFHEQAIYRLPDHYHDTAYDRLKGRLCGFLQTSLYNRGPYPPAREEDIEMVRDWCRREFPEYLQL